MKRTELKRGTSQLKRSAMTKKKTKKLSDFDKEFERMKSLIRRRSNGRCEAMMFAVGFTANENREDLHEFLAWHADNCNGRAVHVHHRKYRKRGGTNASINLLDVSRVCHDWIHAHGGRNSAANRLGLSVSAEESEEI